MNELKQYIEERIEELAQARKFIIALNANFIAARVDTVIEELQSVLSKIEEIENK